MAERAFEPHPTQPLHHTGFPRSEASGIALQFLLLLVSGLLFLSTLSVFQPAVPGTSCSLPPRSEATGRLGCVSHCFSQAASLSMAHPSIWYLFSTFIPGWIASRGLSDGVITHTPTLAEIMSSSLYKLPHVPRRMMTISGDC
ncbi:UNVERIFIED_CONTAM: hypothetical protein K2H54_074660 [Gekko kuhli]